MNKFRKLLVLSFSAFLGLGLAACEKTPSVNPSDSTPSTPSENPSDSTPSTPVENPSDSAPSTPVDSSPSDSVVVEANYAKEAAEYLYETNKESTLKMQNFSLSTKQVTYDTDDNMIFVDVAWSIEVEDGGVEGAIVMGEVDEKGNVPFTVVYNAETSIADTNFTLKCVTTDPLGNTDGFELKCVVPAFKYASYQDFKDAVANKSEDVLNVAGTVVAVYKNGVYLVDSEGYGFYAYKPEFDGTMDQKSLLAAYPIGSKVIASGTATLYSGQYEFNQGCAVKLVEAAAADYEIPYKDATELFATAESQTDAATLGDLVNSVVSIDNITIGSFDGDPNYYYYFTVGDSDVQYYLRTSASYNDFTIDQVNGIVAEWVQGYKANIKGLVGIYGNKYYITPIELDAVTITDKALTDNAKVDIALGNAEKDFGIVFEAAAEVELPATDENGVALTYEVLEGTSIKIESGKLIVTPGETQTTNKLKVTATIGEETDTVEIDVIVNSALPSVTSLADALTMENGTKVFVQGTVSSIKEAWNDGYGNNSVYITDGTTELYVFRLTTKVEVGQEILVSGEIGEYDGAKQIAKGSTAEVLAYDGMYTLAEAVALEDDTPAVVYGTVKEINEDYNSSFDNITVTIVDALGNELYLYRLKGEVKVDDVIVVTGKIGSYKGAKQMVAGATWQDLNTYLNSSTENPADPDTPVEPDTPVVPDTPVEGTVSADFSSSIKDDKALPEGAANWVYITNNPDYPNPNFNKGAYKFDYVNEGLQTVAFAEQTKVEVTVNIKAFNENSKTSNSGDVFAVTAINAAGEVVDTEVFGQSLVVGDNKLVLEGEGIVSVKIIMTDYYFNGNKACNIAVTSITVTPVTE